MKKILVTMMICCIAVFAYAQKVKESAVPQAVKDALYKQYPNAKVEKWEMEDGNYEAEFDNKEVETSVVITPAGEIVMTETEIAVSELPQGARDYVKNSLGNKKIQEASKITTSAGVVTYEAEVSGKDYMFDANGTFTGTEGKDTE